MDREEHWQTVYRTKQENEVSWFQDRPDMSLTLLRQAGLGTQTRIVDVGGGASRLVDHLLDLGCGQVTVLDVAQAALDKARARLGGKAEKVEWIAADVTRWRPDGIFDVWHDRAVFHFLTEAPERAAYVSILAQALRPGGQAIIGTFALDGPERCSGLPVCRYDAAGLAETLGTSFRLVETAAVDHRTPAGKIQKFRFCRLVKTTQVP